MSEMIGPERLIEDVARLLPRIAEHQRKAFLQRHPDAIFGFLNGPEWLAERAQSGVQRGGDPNPPVDERIVPVEQQNARALVWRTAHARALINRFSDQACTQSLTQASNEKSCALSLGAKRSI